MFRLYQSAKNGKPEISKPEETQPPEPIETEITTSEPEEFDIDRHSLMMKAQRYAVELRGPWVLQGRAGRAFVGRVFQALESGDREALQALRDKFEPRNKFPDARTRYLGLSGMQPPTY